MSHDLGKARVIVDLVTESRRIHDGQRYAGAFLIELQLNCDRLDSNAILDMSTLWVIVGILAL